MFGLTILLATVMRFAVCLFIGCRLVWLSKRTRKLPEFAMGASLLGGSVLGYPFVIAARQATGLSSTEAGGLWAVGIFFTSLGFTALYLFTWRVFHGSERWAGAVFAIALLAMFGGLLGQGLSEGYAAQRPLGLASWIAFAARGLSFVWCAYESLRYYGLTRRQARLGLCDRLVSNRILLWGLASLVGCISYADFALVYVFQDGNVSSPTTLAINAVIGIATAVFLWLAFFPPAAYRRRLSSGEPALST